MDNTITLSGNLTRDPELRYTTSGKGVASAGLAVNRRYQVNGEWQEETSFVNLVFWGDLGEHIAASCSKGTRILVTGRLSQREYDDKEGNKRSVMEVVVDDAGPSLRWAEATVERIARDDSTPRASKQTYTDEEEPF